MKKLLLILLICFCHFNMIVFSQGNVTYDNNENDFIFEPGSEYSKTDLFSEFKNVMPGDDIHDQIYIKNEGSKNVKIKVYLKAEVLENDDFLSQMYLSVKAKDDTIYFDGPANNQVQLKDFVYLGTIYSSGELVLDLNLTIPIEMGNEYQDEIGKIKWTFKIEELPIESSDPPKTGDTSNYLYFLSLSVVSFLVMFIVFKKAKTTNDN